VGRHQYETKGREGTLHKISRPILKIDKIKKIKINEI
jgi:hypothetical protein